MRPFVSLENDRRRIWRRWSCDVNFYFRTCCNYIIFWICDFTVYLLLMMLHTNFFYLIIFVVLFFGMVFLVFVLLGSASAWFPWEWLEGLMLYSMEASSWWSSDTSACGWKLRCVEIFWRSLKNWSLMLYLRLLSFSRFSVWILLFTYDVVNSVL